MNSVELIFALLMMLSFSLFIFSMEKEMNENLLMVAKEFENKNNALECASLMNYYYANAGGTLTKNLECEINKGEVFAGNQKAIIIIPEASAIDGKILIEAENHYE